MNSSYITSSIRFISIVFLITIIITICSSCKNSKRSKPTSESTTEEKYIAKLKSDTSNSELMFGLHFGMNRVKVQEILKRLLTSGEILSLDNQGFCYKVDISQIGIPTTFDEHGEANDRTPPFDELYFYAIPAFSNDRLCSIHVTQFLHFNSGEIKDWMNKDLTVVSEEINMRLFAEKCARVIAATDYLLKSKYIFFDVQKNTLVRSESSGMFENKGDPIEDLTTYWAKDFYIRMSGGIKYTKYDYQGIGYEGFGKSLTHSNFSGYQNVIAFNESRILILEYKSPKYIIKPGAEKRLFQENIDKTEIISDQKEELEKIVDDSVRNINEQKKKKELNKF